MLNAVPLSGSVTRTTPPTTVSAVVTSFAPNLTATPFPASSTSPQASHSGAISCALSCTARNVADP